MLFVVRGHLQSSQVLRDGVKSCCMLGPGNFSGDELLSWCLRRPFIERLPPSSSTLVTLETTEAFGLEAEDVKYVTQHFRYTFVKERVKRSARYYSPGWRTWAAVAIQLAWRRYKHRLTLTSLSFIRPRRPLSRCSSLGEDRLRLYTALLTSPKPNQEDFDFWKWSSAVYYGTFRCWKAVALYYLAGCLVAIRPPLLQKWENYT